MSNKKNKTNQDQVPDLDNSQGDPSTSKISEIDLVNPSNDDFSEFFDDTAENVKVQLYRTAPVSVNGQKIDGFLRYIFPGEDIASIAENYGGGTYSVKKLINSRFAGHRSLSIAGLPKVGILPPADGISGDPAKNTDNAGNLIEINGVMVGGEDAIFIKQMRQVAMYKTMFPEKESINDTLLKMVLSQQGGNGGFESILNNVDKIGTLMDRMAPSSGGSSTWIDLGKEAIKAFGQFVEKAGRSPGGIPPAQKIIPETVPDNQLIPGRQIIEKLPENIENTVGKVDDMSENNNETVEPSWSQIAEKASSYIVGGFIMEPVQPESDTVLVLRQVLPAFDRAGLDQVYDNRKSLSLVAKSILSNEIEVTPEVSEKFILYFNNVFDVFCLRSETINEKPNSEAENDQSN